MKKIATIIMLVAAMIVGTLSDTQAATKKKSTGSSFNMKSLVNKLYANKSEPVWTATHVKTMMKELGFKYQGSYTTTILDDYDERIEVDVLKFTKSGVSAEVYLGNKFVFKFSNSSNAGAFVSASKSAYGSALKKRDSSYLYMKNYYYWHLNQNGSVVTIEGGESLDGGQMY